MASSFAFPKLAAVVDRPGPSHAAAADRRSGERRGKPRATVAHLARPEPTPRLCAGRAQAAEAGRKGALAPGLAIRPLLLEAVRAVHGAIAPRHEGHPRGAATRRAGRLVHLARRAAVLAAHLAVRVVAHHAATLAAAARRAAGRAAPRLVGEALLGIEFLLPRGEQEAGAALTAVQGLVAKRHDAHLP